MTDRGADRGTAFPPPYVGEDRRGGRRIIRIVAVSYLVKTLLIGIAWLVVPDLPQRVERAIEATFSSASTAAD
jgi:hypothetical protein